MKIKINPNFSVDVSVVGVEGTKVLVIDDFILNIDEVRDDAVHMATYGEDLITAYPGVRAVLPDEYVTQVLTALTPLLEENYVPPAHREAKVELAYYSLLTKRESELDILQRVPHFDTNKKHYYAALHYLNPGDFGGTGFFRHRPTQFEKITVDRSDIFRQSASAFMAVRGMPAPTYIRSTTNHFELFSQVAYKPNRLVVYPGCLLHSGLVSAELDIDDNPATGRLTANIFIDYE